MSSPFVLSLPLSVLLFSSEDINICTMEIDSVTIVPNKEKPGKVRGILISMKSN
jgi:hypothetical protein